MRSTVAVPALDHGGVRDVDDRHSGHDPAHRSRAPHGSSAIAALEQLQLVKVRIAALERAAVLSARTDGRSWAEIADALRVTKQAAWERWHTTAG